MAFKQANSAFANVCAFGSLSTAGDAILCSVTALMGSDVAPTVSVQDNAGNTNYVQAGAPAECNDSGFFTFTFYFYCLGIKTSATVISVTATVSGTPALVITGIAEYSLPAGAIADASSYKNPNGSSLNISFVALLATANELLTSFTFFAAGAGATPGAGWTQRDNTTGYLLEADILSGGFAGSNTFNPANQTSPLVWGSVFLAFYVPPPLVPNVVGDSLSAAEAAIVAAGFTVGPVTYSSSLTVPYEHIISQSPIAGSTESPGTAVNLTVSNGPPVPSVIGLTLSSAEASLIASGFVVGVISNLSSPTAPSGNVIAQSPSAGSAEPPATAINLVVSTGPPIPPPPSGATDGWPGGWIPGY